MEISKRKENIENIYRLSPTQEGILFHSLNSPKSSVYVNQFCCRLSGKLHYQNLQDSWNLVFKHHSVLRTLFTWERREKPLQIVRKQVDVPWSFIDLQDFSPVEQTQKFQDFLKSDRDAGFDLAKAPLVRFSLFQLTRSTFQFVWSYHHIILDGWSLRLLLREAFSNYFSLGEGVEVPIKSSSSFQHYVHWLHDKDLAAAEVFWKTRLQSFFKPNKIYPSNEESKSVSEDLRYQQKCFEISELKSSELQQFSRQNHLTLNSLFQGAWAFLIGNHSGDVDIVFGATHSGRSAFIEGIESMVGIFINTLPVRIYLDPEKNVLSWFQDIQKAHIESSSFDYSPLVKVQRWSQVPRDQTLFESIVVFENHPTENEQSFGKGGLTIDDVEYLERSNYPLALIVVPGSKIQCIFVYDSLRFREDYILTLFQHLQRILVSIISCPQQKLSHVQMLTDTELRHILVDFNPTPALPPIPRFWLQEFEQRISATAGKVALVYGDEQLSYDELNKRANQIAWYLSEKGVKADSLVGIYLGRSTEMIVALLAILKAGGAYVPLDPNYPEERLKFMLEDTKVSYVLTQQSLVPQLPSGQWQPVFLDKDAELFAPYSVSNLSLTLRLDHLAYVIYTSGSTGKPKGVMVTRENLYRSTAARMGYYRNPPDRFLLFSTYAFDSSVAGIFWTLLEGGTLVIPEDDRFIETPYLAKLIEQNKVTHLLCVPSFYEQLLKSNSSSLRSLKVSILAGESCPRTLIDEHFQHNAQADLFNEYGPTEATVWSTVYQCSPEQKGSLVPIGKPLPFASVYVLNSNLKPVAIGVPGELFIGGRGLARGYLNQPDLTKEKFIPNPFNDKADDRLYKTGDIVRFLPDGVLEFLGRNDDQVKIRGYRIELDEIMNVIKAHSSVDQAVVMIEKTPSKKTPNDSLQKTEVEFEELKELISSINQDTRTKWISEIESLSALEVRRKLEIEMGDLTVPATVEDFSPQEEEVNPSFFDVRQKSGKGFEIQLKLKSKHFISPPRETQREWLITQLLNEVADDLLDLDMVAKKFVPGSDMKDRGNLDDVTQAELSEQEILEDWQIPIMETMALKVTENHGDVLEIGFGRGVSATYIQENGVRSHTIVECNEYSITNHFEPWRKNYPGNPITLIRGRWEDVEHELEFFDSIFFHAFPLNDEEFIKYVVNRITFAEHFFPIAAKHLRVGGIFTYLTTEINSLSRRHQRALLQYFSSLTMSVKNLTIPQQTRDAWWADRMVIITAVK